MRRASSPRWNRSGQGGLIDLERMPRRNRVELVADPRVLPKLGATATGNYPPRIAFISATMARHCSTPARASSRFMGSAKAGS